MSAVDDVVLPAAAHLMGPNARAVLDAALEALDGRLEVVRPTHLHYRPGYDIVVRFDTRVSWGGRDAVDETLVASATVNGPPADTLRVEATTDDGTELAVGVWRWPFDPVLTGLADAVTPSTAGTFLDGMVDGRVKLKVVAYRPTQRAVVRTTDRAGTVYYVKVVAPSEVATIVERHDLMLAAGVPVPAILRSDTERGLVAMEALVGRTVRERIKSGHRRLPGPARYEELYAALARVDLSGAPAVVPRTASALHHGRMLASVLPADRGRLGRLADLLEPAAERAAARSGPTIHGDLYEGQLITGRGPGRTDTIAGLLDLDDAGPGDPYDDRATVLAHLFSRTVDERSHETRRIARYAHTLRDAFAEHVDPAELDLAIAGTMVGLATGPFRMQHPRWQRAVRRRLDFALRLAARPGRPKLRIGL